MLKECFILKKEKGNRLSFSTETEKILRFSKNLRNVFQKTIVLSQSTPAVTEKLPWGKSLFSIYQFAEDLKDFMDYHKIEKADILGFSDGGNIAMIFASKYPERVEKLILNGANTKPSGMKTAVHFAMRISYIFYCVFDSFSVKIAREKALYSLMLNEPNVTSDELKKISAPTLVLVGTEDMIKESETRFIAKNIPDSELCFVLGGHFILKDNFKDYCFAVKKFLDK